MYPAYERKKREKKKDSNVDIKTSNSNCEVANNVSMNFVHLVFLHNVYYVSFKGRKLPPPTK